MTTIRTTCPQCGEVDMTPEAILLSIRHRSGEGSYSFSCPTCLHTVEKPADRKVAALLLSAGVEVADEAPEFGDFMYEREYERADREVQLEDRPDGPPFTIDDLISFHFLLKDEDAFEQALPRA